MEKFRQTIIDSEGNIIPLATVNVYDTGTTNSVSIFSDDGVTSESNPFTTGTDAVVKFYAADGRYDIKITKSGFDDILVVDQQLFDLGITGATGGISNTGNTTIEADSDGAGGGDILLQINGSTKAKLQNSGDWLFPLDTNFAVGGGVNGFSIDGTTFSIDATNRRLGVGIAVPIKRFHVHDVFPFFMTNPAVTDKAFIFNLGAGGTFDLKSRLDDGTAVQTHIGIAHNSTLTLNPSGGNVGVNIVIPTEAFEVDGTIQATDIKTDVINEKTGAAGVTIDSVLLKDGDFVPTSGKGVDFTAAGGDLFEDYDKGTYTMTATTSTDPLTLSTNTVSFVKKDREVTITGRIDVGSVGTSTGTVNFLLPFEVAAESEGETHSTGTIRTNFNQSDSAAYLASYTLAGQSFFVINELVDNVEPATIAASSVIAGDHFTFTLTYFTDL